MAYQIYTTPALVCGSFDRNTSDRFYYLFTRDAGMILAHAKSVREERSKHRFALQDFGLADVSLVRGRTGWKVTGSVSDSNYYFQMPDRERRAAVLRLVQLLRRLVQGEESHRDLFEMLRGGVDAIAYCDDDVIELLEILISLKIVHMLGYVAPQTSLKHVLEAEQIEDALKEAKALPTFSKDAREAVDAALYAAQL